MNRKWAIRWKLLGLCLAAAVAWDLLYLWLSLRVDPNHRFDLWLAEAPRWVRQLYLWTPHLLAARILKVFGFRFDMQHYDDNTGFMLASTGLTWLIWTVLLYGLVALVRRLRRPAGDIAAA